MSETTTTPDDEDDTDIVDQWAGSLNKADNTVSKYTGNVRDWKEWLEKDGLSLWDADNVLLKGYLEQKDTVYAKSTVNGYNAAIGRFYKDAVDMSILTHTHGKENYDVPVPEEIPEGIGQDVFDEWDFMDSKPNSRKSEILGDKAKYLSPKEVKKLEENVPTDIPFKDTPVLMNRLIIRLLYQSGLRAGELANLRISDIDTDERTIHVRPFKTDKARKTYFQPNTDLLLDRWLTIYRGSFSTADKSPYLFPGERAEHIHPNDITELVRETAKIAGIQEIIETDAAGNPRYKVAAHALRHTFAVQSLKNGVSVKAVQEALGHTDLEVTMTYLELIDKHIQEEFEEKGAGTESIEE